MTNLRKAAEMALEALEFLVKNELSKKGSVKAHFRLVTIPALRQALAQPERKWVGLTKRDLEGYSPELKTVLEYIEAILKRKNT